MNCFPIPSKKSCQKEKAEIEDLKGQIVRIKKNYANDLEAYAAEMRRQQDEIDEWKNRSNVFEASWKECKSDRRNLIEQCNTLREEATKQSEILAKIKGQVRVEFLEKGTASGWIWPSVREAHPTIEYFLGLDIHYAMSNRKTVMEVWREFDDIYDDFLSHQYTEDYDDCENRVWAFLVRLHNHYHLNQAGLAVSRVHAYCNTFYPVEGQEHEYEHRIFEPQNGCEFGIEVGMNQTPDRDMPELVVPRTPIRGRALREPIRMDEAIAAGVYRTEAILN